MADEVMHSSDRALAEELVAQGRTPEELEELMGDLARIRSLPETTTDEKVVD